jgi:L-aspartate oxidase
MTQCDYLIIGSGIAGLSLALRLAESGTVTIISKKSGRASNTLYAQGGIASVVDELDSFDAHVADTLRSGDGLCNEAIVRLVVENGPLAIEQLLNWGVAFSEAEKGQLSLGREGGHSHNRIVHAKDATGKEIELRLLQHIAQHKNIELLHDQVAIDFITEHQLIDAELTDSVTCFGAYVFDSNEGVTRPIQAKYTILCSGGAGMVYEHTTNPSIATGDGIAMAYRAGCKIENLEFMQFHPTSLYRADKKASRRAFLISEAVRGFGAILRTADGRAFMSDYDDRAELASRDIVARAIDSELKRRGDECVYLDLTHRPKAEIESAFPTIFKHCLSLGIDISTNWIPVVPAAHYMCGGVKVNSHGRTQLERLYACGEVASTGLHGANRLASNSLLEALVFSDQVFNDLTQRKSEKIESVIIPEWDDTGTINMEEWGFISHDVFSVRKIMWDYVGIVRSDFRLKRALSRIDLILSEVEKFYKKSKIFKELLELRNMVTVAQLIIRSAQKRKESRGLHFTHDYLEKLDIAKNTVLRSSRFIKGSR